MKTSTHFVAGATLVITVVLGCVTPRPAPPAAVPAETDDLKTRINAAANDRNNWVDPTAPRFYRLNVPR